MSGTLPELPASWEWKTLSEIASTQLGKMLSAKARGGVNPLPYLRNQNVQWGRFELDDLREMDFSATEVVKFSLRRGDLVMCEGGEPGRCAIWDSKETMLFQKALHRIRPTDAVLPEWLFYYFRWLAHTGGLAPYTSGIGIRHLPQEDLRLIRVPLPPIHEQESIIEALDSMLLTVDRALEDVARASRDAVALDTSLLSSTLAAYSTTDFGSLISDVRYGTSVKCTADANGPAVLRIPNVRRGRLDTSELKFATTAAQELGDSFVRDRDLLFIRTNGSRDLIGRVAMVEGCDGFAFASYLIRARVDESRLDASFASLALASSTLRREIESLAASSAGQYNLNIRGLKSLRIPLPPREEQVRIVEAFTARRAELEAGAAELADASERADALKLELLRRAMGAGALSLVDENVHEELVQAYS